MLIHAVDLDVMDEQGNTALGSAAKARQHEAVAFLLQSGAKLSSECVSCWPSTLCLLSHMIAVYQQAFRFSFGGFCGAALVFTNSFLTLFA